MRRGFDLRITNTQGLQSARKGRGAGKASDVSGFSDHLSSAGNSESAAPAGELSLLSPMGSFLALQDESFIDQKPMSAFDQGNYTLDKLRDLQLAMLDGEPDRALLLEIGEAASQRGDGPIEPEVSDVLDEIEVRAAVELAKLDTSV